MYMNNLTKTQFGTFKMNDETEIRVGDAACYNNTVNGCVRHKAFAMIGIRKANKHEFMDLFFNTREELEQLRDSINKVLDQ